jgi:hypothetical protein
MSASSYVSSSLVHIFWWDFELITLIETNESRAQICKNFNEKILI